MHLFVGSLAIAFAVSFMCSLLEAAVLSLTPGQIAELSRKRPRLGEIWKGFKTNIERPIAVILILNTSAHTIGATVAGAQFEALFGRGYIALFSVLFTLAMLQFTEILPKSLGVRFNRPLAPIIAVPLEVLTRVFRPVVWLVHFVNRPFEVRMKAPQAASALEEITALAGLARLSNQINPYQERVFAGAMRLSQTSAAQIMIPGEQVTFLSSEQSIGGALVTAHMDPHTRFPLCEKGDPDRVLGYVNFKELVAWAKTNPADPSLRGIARPVHFVEPGQSAATTLTSFVEEHVHLAIVRSKEGRTLGLITMEDVVEELVGELEDEFDRLPRSCQALSAGTLMVGGGYPAAELLKSLGLPAPASPCTTSAWLIRRMGRVPKPGDIHREGDFGFMSRRTRRGKVFEVMVTRVGGTDSTAVSR